MNPSLLSRRLAVEERCHHWGLKHPTIPDTADIVSGDDLREAACFHMTDFDESAVEQQNVRQVQCNTLCSAFPLD
jgi:hypothetical protein